MNDYRKTMVIDLMQWAAQDRRLAGYCLGMTEGLRWEQLAEAEEAEIQARLAKVKLPPRYINLGASGAESLRGLCYGVPDSDRIYGSSYLARHPEIQEDAYDGRVNLEQKSARNRARRVT